MSWSSLDRDFSNLSNWIRRYQLWFANSRRGTYWRSTDKDLKLITGCYQLIVFLQKIFSIFQKIFFTDSVKLSWRHPYMPNTNARHKKPEFESFFVWKTVEIVEQASELVPETGRKYEPRNHQKNNPKTQNQPKICRLMVIEMLKKQKRQKKPKKNAKRAKNSKKKHVEKWNFSQKNYWKVSH